MTISKNFVDLRRHLNGADKMTHPPHVLSFINDEKLEFAINHLTGNDESRAELAIEIMGMLPLDATDSILLNQNNHYNHYSVRFEGWACLVEEFSILRKVDQLNDKILKAALVNYDSGMFSGAHEAKLKDKNGYFSKLFKEAEIGARKDAGPYPKTYDESVIWKENYNKLTAQYKEKVHQERNELLHRSAYSRMSWYGLLYEIFANSKTIKDLMEDGFSVV